MNKRYIYMLCFMLSAALSLTSCLKDDDEDDISSRSDDMAILSFYLASVNRTVLTTSSAGADSTYRVTLTTTSLPTFTIDHLKQQIYNIEPLPAGCDLKHVIASIYTNSGSIVMKSMVGDTLTYYNESDSIDFSQTREVRVYAANGSGYRAYQVTINANTTVLDGLTWEKAQIDGDGVPASVFQTTQMKAGDSNKTFMLSQDSGKRWSEETIGNDEDASLLPTGEVAWVSFPHSSSPNTDYELIAGTCHGDTCTVWRKIVDRSSEADEARWVNIPLVQSNKYNLPQMAHLNLIWFNEGLYAIGSDKMIYQSRDQGITWKTTTSIKLPEDLQSDNFRIVTDKAGTLWLLDIENNLLWNGKPKYREHTVS